MNNKKLDRLEKGLLFVLAGLYAYISHNNKTRHEVEMYKELEEARIERLEKHKVKDPVDGEYKEVE